MNKWTKKKALILLPLLSVVFLLVIVIAVTGKTESAEGPSDVDKIVTKQLGNENGSKKPRIVESKKAETSTGHNIVLTLNANENSRAKEMMWQHTAEIVEPLSDIDNTENILIEWLYPLQDQYGKVEDSRVMMLNISKSTRDKINWDAFDYTKLPDIADEYFEHPAISK